MNAIYYRSDDLKLNIDDSFWILDGRSKLWEDTNTSLHPSTIKYLKKLFLSENAAGDKEVRDPKSHSNYLHFYRKFLHPLIPLTKERGNIEDLMKVTKNVILERTDGNAPPDSDDEYIDSDDEEVNPNIQRKREEILKRKAQQTGTRKSTRKTQWTTRYPRSDYDVTQGRKGRRGGKKTRKRKPGRLTRRTPRYSGGKKTRKRKSKFPYISRGGGLI